MITEESGQLSTNSSRREPVCPLCEGAVRQTAFVGPHPLERCSSCSLEFLFPQPDDDALAGIYGHRYFLHDGATDAEERMSTMKRATAALYLDALSGFCQGE